MDLMRARLAAGYRGPEGRLPPSPIQTLVSGPASPLVEPEPSSRDALVGPKVPGTSIADQGSVPPDSLAQQPEARHCVCVSVFAKPRRSAPASSAVVYGLLYNFKNNALSFWYSLIQASRFTGRNRALMPAWMGRTGLVTEPVGGTVAPSLLPPPRPTPRPRSPWAFRRIRI